MSSRRPSRERGSGSVLAVAGVGLVLALAVAGLTLGGVAVATHRARAAADFAALAAATSLQAGASAEACARAADVAARNSGRLEECGVEVGETVRVRVTTALSVRWPGLPERASASARAGPAPAAPADSGRTGPG